MCRVLQVNRITYYYEANQKKDESELVSDITEIFKSSHNNYGTRKIKKELFEKGKQVSQRKIGRIMKQEGLVSTYITAQFKLQKDRLVLTIQVCDNESSKYWLSVLNELKNRGVKDILILCAEWLAGIPDEKKALATLDQVAENGHQNIRIP